MSSYTVLLSQAVQEAWRAIPWQAACIPEQPDPLPEGFQDIIKRLNSVWGGSFSQGSNGQRCDGLHLLVLVCQTVLDDVHQGLHNKGHTQLQTTLLLCSVDNAR